MGSYSALVEELEILLCEDPIWKHPGIEGDESGEIKRTSDHLGIPHEKLKAAVAKGQVGPLEPSHWDALQNTDSNQLRGKKHAKKQAKLYKRNIHKIFKGFRKQKEMPAPIVLHHGDEAPYLIGGNTRLMAAKASGIKPHVVHVHVDRS